MRVLLVLLFVVGTAHADDHADFKRHMAEGDRLAKQEQWAEAVRAYIAAAELDPRDSRVWSALTWAQVNDGQVVEAEKLCYAAIKAGHDARLLAPLFYNLGRALEAQTGRKSHLALAAAAYAHSLALRPAHPTVRAALERVLLGLRDPEGAALLAFVRTCSRSLAGGQAWEDPESGCESVEARGLPAPLAVLAVSPSFFPQIREWTYLLVSGNGSSARIVATLGKRYLDLRPGGAYLSGAEELEVGAARVLELAGRRVLALELTALDTAQADEPDDKSEADPPDESFATSVLYCSLEPLACPLRLPLRAGDVDGGKRRVTVELAHAPQGGQVKVSLVRGQPDAELGKSVGVHPLW